MRPDGPRDDYAGPDEGPALPFPLKLDGKVIKGFGRGSSELGIPTANIPLEGLSVGGKQDVESGIYFGWAGLSPTPPPRKSAEDYTLMQPAIYQALLSATEPQPQDAVYPMVMSIGWNPFYKNTVRSVEVHLMAPLAADFYGSHMSLVVLGFIRPEYDYVSKESLVADIRTDIDVAGRSLAREGYVRWRGDAYLRGAGGGGDVAS